MRKLEFGKLYFTKLSPVNISCSVQGGGSCVSLESHLVKSTVLLTALDVGYMGYKHFAWYDGCDGRRDTLLVHSIYRGIYTRDTPERGAKGRTVKTLKCRQAMLAVIFGSGLTE